MSSPKSGYSTFIYYAKETAKVLLYLALFSVVTITALKVGNNNLPDVRLELIREWPEPCPPDSLCLDESILPDDGTLSEFGIDEARIFVRNHNELGIDGTGFLITNEMLITMVMELNTRPTTLDIDGFHVYYANQRSDGSEPAIIIVPVNREHIEFELEDYKVLRVERNECAPCPMLCEGYGLRPPGDGE
jgi:hypothetical protein